MTSEKITKEELSSMLVEKHKNFTREYKKEFDLLDRIAILKEKEEQLAYWVNDSKDNPEQNKKYVHLKNTTENELTRLKDELKSLHDSDPSRGSNPFDNDSKNRHKWLKGQITMHEGAVKYWEDYKTKGVQAEKAAKTEPKDSQGQEALKKIKKIKKAKKVVNRASRLGKKK